jgi:hypothetical protein
MFFAGQVPENDGEFVAAETCDDVVVSAASLNHSAGLLKHVVADGVAVGVVVMFEVVDVEDQQCDSEVMQCGQIEYLRQELAEVASVLKAGQIVLNDEFFEFINAAVFIGVVFSDTEGRRDWGAA